MLSSGRGKGMASIILARLSCLLYTVFRASWTAPMESIDVRGRERAPMSGRSAPDLRIPDDISWSEWRKLQ